MKCFKSFTAAALLAIFAMSTVLAQQGGGQFGDFREKHKYTFQLSTMVRNIGEIDKDSKYTLTQEQAKKVLAVLQPLRSKPKLTQDQAKEALKNLKKIFTVNQLNAMARIKQPQRTIERRPERTPRLGGNQASRPRMDPNAMKDFNPFYTKVDSKNEFAVQRAKRMNEFFKAMEKKAKGTKPAAPAKKK